MRDPSAFQDVAVAQTGRTISFGSDEKNPSWAGSEDGNNSMVVSVSFMLWQAHGYLTEVP